jgi:hypothetical protein
MQTLVPYIDETVPLPANAAEALPDLTPAQELNMRVRTIKLISDLTGQPIIPTEQDKDAAEQMARKMMEDPDLRPEYSMHSDEFTAYLSGLVYRSNGAIVKELSELKNYVINKLVMEIETTKDPKLRVQAVSKLGEIDGVDAFKKRSEITHQVKPIEEVEKELMQVLEGIEYSVVDNKTPEINPDDYLLPDQNAATDA